MSRRPATLLATAATLALALPATSLAAGFGPPRGLRYGAPAPLPGRAAVVLNEDALGVAVADTGGTLASGAAGPHTLATAFTNGVFLDRKTFTPTNTAVGPDNGQLAPYAHTGLAIAGLHRTHTASQAVLSFGRLGPNRAQAGALHPVGPAGLQAHAPVLAADPAGDLAMAFAVCRDGGCRSSLVYLATRRAGSSHITTTRVGTSTRTLPRVAVAINGRGDALAVWTDLERVRARVRTAGGTLRATQTVGATQRGSLAAPSAALSLHRAELVGWSTQVVHEGDPTAGEVRVAQSRGGAFAQTRLATLPALSGQSVASAVVRVAFGATGLRRLAWTGYDGGHFTVRTALLHGAANSGTASLVDAQTLSAPRDDAILDDLELAGPRTLVVLRSGLRGDEPQPGGEAVQVAEQRTASGPFALATVSGSDPVDGPADAALIPGRALVVYGATSMGARYVEEVG
ncbi:hypothetical protein NBH00_22580 [Paraconexibacter antarcticus]|uniref:Uncharacterized protein n=1 Tax=Paraconexibacter antarcticus TaxID=2949664 RepID=A0ABY5DT17_9ACTN|nr:hypothetical protein [Paraconexibacter antarcticus]UTI64111.1 hypothetical protein NBH00_22580 [Paraconexibacter antarcticus]